MKNSRLVFVAAVASALSISSAHADAGALTGGSMAPQSGYVPRVPVSALARPATWLDPSRLRVSASVSVGSGFGRGVEALQVTTLSYRFDAPVWMSVSLGNGLGSRAANGGSFFLEGLDAGYQPLPGLLFQVHYRNVRSPLQFPTGADAGYWRP
jgi:hypothetical protein